MATSSATRTRSTRVRVSLSLSLAHFDFSPNPSFRACSVVGRGTDGRTPPPAVSSPAPLPRLPAVSTPGKDAINRKPVSGKLYLTLKGARDLEHAPLPSGGTFSRSKPFNETTVEFKVHGVVKDFSHASRTDRWLQDFVLEMDKADEVEVAFYDQPSGGKKADVPPRILIGIMWLKVSDLLEALRRQKVDAGFDGDAAGWVTAATVSARGGQQQQQQQLGGQAGGFATAAAGRSGLPSQQVGPNGRLVGGPSGSSGGGGGGAAQQGPDGLDGWFTVEPMGAVNLHLDFGAPPPSLPSPFLPLGLCPPLPAL